MAKRKTAENQDNANQDTDATFQGEIGQLGVGQRVKVGDREGEITEVVKDADEQVRHYRVGFRSEQPQTVVAGGPLVTPPLEVETFEASEVQVVDPVGEQRDIEQLEPGQQVIARGGERGTIEKVERRDEENAKNSSYLVQFGGRLGRIEIRGEELQKYVFNPQAAAEANR